MNAKSSILPFFLALVAVVISQDSSDPITHITFTIDEELLPGSPVGSVSGEAAIEVTEGSNFKITTKDQDLLVMANETTGELRTARTIDRETVCRNEIKCENTIQVVSVQPYIVLTVTLVINDINDNQPSFGKNIEEVNLSELQSPGVLKPLQAAIDLDKGDGNGDITYELSSLGDSTNKFELIVENTVPVALKLKLVDALDRETVDHYTLLVLAKDNGIPRRTGTLTVEVNVLDDNDNKPVFDDAVVNVSVTEDIAVGKVIYTFRAKDIDAGNNGEVEYLLDQYQSNFIYISEHFAVNRTTGELSVISKLEYEDGNSEKVIKVVATDKGDNAQSAIATLYLTVKDVDNNAPEISTTILLDDLFISENTPVNTAILHVSVTDSDTGVDGQVTCRMYNTYFGLEKVPNVDKNYKVFVQHELNRETVAEHNVTITCQDGGGLETSTNFHVTIKDENDNTPHFSPNVYFVNVTENNSIGAELLTVSATDKDIGDYGRISYKIPSEFSEEFEVEETTGIVRAKVPLDRENDTSKQFTVLAVDNDAANPRTGTATVYILILDINDNSPIFTNPGQMYNFRVREGLGSNTHVDFVTALDPDTGDNGRVTYDILPEYKIDGAHAVPFEIVGDGEIKTTMDLDCEQKSEYMFTVIALDFGNPRLTSTINVRVTVDDANDETPVFVFPTADNKSVTALNEVSNTPIATLSAVDLDIGINQDLIYFIQEGDINAVFSLEPNTGELYIVKYIHLKEDTQFDLIVSVYDKGDPPLSARTELIVNLKYTNMTTVEPSSDVKKSYVIIVVTVVCVTCLLSITMITVICLIRRKDLNKCGGNAATKLRMPTISGKMNAGKSHVSQQLASDKIYPTESVQQKNKKEVSFSIDDGDSLSSNDFRPLTMRTGKDQYGGRQTVLPEESSYDLERAGILSPSKTYTQAHSKYQDHVDHDGQLNVSHQREDSHSETSAETATSHDSGRGNSVDGDNHDLKFDASQVNQILHKQTTAMSSPNRSSSRSPTKPANLKSALKYRDNVDGFGSAHVHSGVHSYNPAQTRNWCHTYDANGSYPESDYHSMGSNPNCSQNHIPSYRDDVYTYSSNPDSANQVRTSSLSKNFGYYDPGLSDLHLAYRNNSVREDDETTTTSGSYTINHDDVDEDLRAQYQMSQVV